MAYVEFLLMLVLFFLAIFLIVLVLIQRGRGGGLAGAFGGMGGQSAFGTKAGDMFTKITVGVASVWIVLCIVSIKVLSASSDRISLPGPPAGQQSAPADTGSSGAVPSDGATSGAPAAAESTAPAGTTPGSSDSPAKQ